MSLRPAPILAAALVLVTACPATAETVTTSTSIAIGSHDQHFTETTVHVTAAPGEQNRLTIRNADGGGIVITDAGASLSAGGSCLDAGGGAVRCPDVSSLEVDAGDGDDTVTLNADVPARVWGGEGRDDVDAAMDRNVTWLHGGPGDDVLAGGWDTMLTGGPGDDRLSASRLGSLPLPGTVDYSDHAAPVSVRLGDPGHGGSAGEHDEITGDVEHIIGGAGNDVLIGDDRPNHIVGGPGDDRIEGRGGADWLDGGGQGVKPTADAIFGGHGRDDIRTGAGGTADGGPGNDELQIDGGRAHVRGGPGSDNVGIVGRGAIVDLRDGATDFVQCLAPAASATVDVQDPTIGCGRAVIAPRPGIALPVQVEPGGYAARATVDVGLVCPDEALRGCAPRITVRVGAAVFGRRRVALAPGTIRTVHVRLPRRLRVRFYRDSRLPVAVTSSMRDASGDARSVVLRSCLVPLDDYTTRCDSPRHPARRAWF